MHPEAYAFLADHAKPAKAVLDVGGRNINGSPRDLFPDAAYTALDVVDGNGVDVVADITEWSSKRKYDVVICAEVLEHAANWRTIAAACWERVKVGGTLLVTCATEGRAPHSAVDGGMVRVGEFYENVQGDDLAGLLRGLGAENTSIDAHLDRGDLYAKATKPRGGRG